MAHDRCSTLLTEFSTALTTILPILFQYCYKCCYIWFNPPFLWKCLYQVRVITVFTVFRLLTDFVCLLTYEFWLSLWKIVRSSVICYYPYLFITQHANYQIHKDHLVLGYQYKRELTLCYMYYSKSNWQLNNKLQNGITLRMHAHLSTQEIIFCTGEVYSSRNNIMW